MQRFAGKFIRHDVLTQIGVLLTALFAAPLSAETLLHVRASAHPDRSNPQAAITFEGKYAPPFSPRLELYLRIDRPFNRFENFALPFLRAEVQLPLISESKPGQLPPWALQLRPFVSVLALERWNSDGPRGRSGVNLVLRRVVGPQLSLQAELAPWLELSRYKASPDGREFPQFGFTQRLAAEISYRSVFLELVFLGQQSFRTLWRNDWGLQQRLGYRFSPAIQAGLSHDLVTGRMDDSTGLLRPVALYDARQSRFAVFGEFLL